MYLSENNIFKKSLKRVSKAVLTIAIKQNERIKRTVAQSLDSKTLGCNNASIIISTKILFLFRKQL